MKFSAFFVVVAVVGAVVPVSGLRAEGNLDDRGSVVKPRVREAELIAADGGLAFLLNKYIRSVQGENKVALEKAQENLKNATDNSKKLASDLKLSMEAVKKAEARAAVVKKQLEELAIKEGGHPSKYISNGGKLLEEGGSISLGRTVAGVELTAAEARALELMVARDAAVKAVENLGAEVNGVKEIVTKSGLKLRVLRIVGNTAIVLDAVGHGWAFYENSNTPVMLGGGILKLGQEANDQVFAAIEAMRSEPKKAIEPPPSAPLPTRAQPKTTTTVDEKGTHTTTPEAPRNNLPPIQKTRPTLPGPKLP